VALLWSQVHRPVWLHRRHRREGNVAGVHAVRRLCLATDAAVPDSVPVQRALLTGSARPRLLVSVWHVRWQL